MKFTIVILSLLALTTTALPLLRRAPQDNAAAFAAMPDQYNELQEQKMEKTMKMQKAQAFWNPLESMSKSDATTHQGAKKRAPVTQTTAQIELEIEEEDSAQEEKTQSEAEERVAAAKALATAAAKEGLGLRKRDFAADVASFQQQEAALLSIEKGVSEVELIAVEEELAKLAGGG
jgi:hypothetical protein